MMLESQLSMLRRASLELPRPLHCQLLSSIRFISFYSSSYSPLISCSSSQLKLRFHSLNSYEFCLQSSKLTWIGGTGDIQASSNTSVSVCFLLPFLRLKLPADLALYALVRDVLRIAVWRTNYSCQYLLKFGFFAQATTIGHLSVAAYDVSGFHADFQVTVRGFQDFLGLCYARLQAIQPHLYLNVEQFNEVCRFFECQLIHLVLIEQSLHGNRTLLFLYQVFILHCQLLIIALIRQIYSNFMSLLEKISEIEQPQSSIIKPLKPLVFNFFISDRPEVNQQTLEDMDTTYKSFHSQRLEHRNNHYFRPTINPKKLNEQPRFRLSVQKKRVKAMSGVTQKASSEKPSRNSYRGSKVKTATNRSMINQQELEALESPKPKKVESSEMSNRSPRKSKQPHLHFNLRHILQTSKTFTGRFSREDEIQGTSFPYYNYFSSEKWSLPKTQKSLRSKNNNKIIENQRYISTTVGLREFSYNL